MDTGLRVLLEILLLWIFLCIFVWTPVVASLGIWVGFLGSAVTLCLTFWGTARSFSRMACSTLHSHWQPGKVPVSPQWQRKWKRKRSCSAVSDSATLRTVAYQASPPMRFSRLEYWSGLSFPSPGVLPDPRIEPGSPALQADALPSEPPGKPNIQ